MTITICHELYISCHSRPLEQQTSLSKEVKAAHVDKVLIREFFINRL